MSPTIRTDWTPHKGQKQVIQSDARFKIVACGRRWGKTESSAYISFKYMGDTDNELIWWVAPTYDIADIGFETVEEMIPEAIITDRKLTKPKSITIDTGVEISFRSADREDSLRGEGVDLLVLDEASMIPSRAWQKELRPTLTDTEGDMIAISTPKSRNWFYDMYELSEDKDYIESWQQTTYDNPHIPDDEIHKARDLMPDEAFEVEYLAKFREDTGSVFNNIDDYLFNDDQTQRRAEDDKLYATGWDLARHQDYLVGITIDEDGNIVDYHRSQNDSWAEVERIIQRRYAEYGGIVSIDASRDNKIVEDLDRQGIRIEPVKFSPKRKRELIENLITGIESEELSSPVIPQLRREMLAFEYDTTRSGKISYDAPQGYHDDTIDALALAFDVFSDIRSYSKQKSDSNGVKLL